MAKVKFVLLKTDSSLQEYRCKSCGALLLKYKPLNKALSLRDVGLEIKCRKCGIVNKE